MSQRSVSLRGRIRWIVVGGAILPMALIGVWLAASTRRSARDLLRAALDSAVVSMRADIMDRWTYRQGDLELLRRNEAVAHVLQSAVPSSADTAYLSLLKANLLGSVAGFVIRDSADHIRLDSDSLPATKQSLVRAGTPSPRVTSLSVRRPVYAADGKALGSVEAWIPVSALVSVDRGQTVFNGTAFRITDARSGAVLLSWTRPLSASSSTVERSARVDDPPLQLEVAADDAPYVAPFANAAKVGLISLIGVAAFALLLTTFLTSRVTRSLEKIMEAAGAVAEGDLERRVDVAGDDDIARLGGAFNSMTDGLRQTLHTLSRQESLVAVGEFAARLSHEVRNALTSVRLDLQRVQERMRSDRSDTVLVDRSLASVERLNRIVTGALRIARTDPEAMQPVSLEGVARAALTSVDGATPGGRVELHLDVRDQVLVRADAIALEQAVVNLLLNAVHAMRDGGTGSLIIEREGEWAKLSVADTGRGISPSDLQRLGEPFFSSKPDGTGLGFSIARQIVTTHGGRLSVASTGPAGTVIEVLLRPA